MNRVFVIGIFAAVLIAIFFGLTLTNASNSSNFASAPGRGSKRGQHSSMEHQQHILEAAAGERVQSQDPAMQRQISLARAASAPNDSAGNSNNPAAGVQGSYKRVNPKDVLNNGEHVTSAGCLIGYGRPGEQCVPARGSSGNTATCADIRQQFPHGVAVTGNDYLHLDRNHDGTACGAGD